MTFIALFLARFIKAFYYRADWQEFDERDDLYRKAFENESVIIFAPREIKEPG